MQLYSLMAQGDKLDNRQKKEDRKKGLKSSEKSLIEG